MVITKSSIVCEGGRLTGQVKRRSDSIALHLLAYASHAGEQGQGNGDKLIQLFLPTARRGILKLGNQLKLAHIVYTVNLLLHNALCSPFFSRDPLPRWLTETTCLYTVMV